MHVQICAQGTEQVVGPKNLQRRMGLGFRHIEADEPAPVGLDEIPAKPQSSQVAPAQRRPVPVKHGGFESRRRGCLINQGKTEASNSSEKPASIAPLGLAVRRNGMMGSRAFLVGKRITWHAGRLPQATILLRPILQPEAGAFRDRMDRRSLL